MVHRFTFLAALIWSALIAGSALFNLDHLKSTSMSLAYAEAQAILNKDITFRRWGTRHGGVYVPVGENQQPIPFMGHVPGRDVTTTDGVKLTLVNPASMLRQMMDAYAEEFGVRGRIVGLKHLNPNNAPDEWETQQIHDFAADMDSPREVWKETEIDGEPFLRYLRAMHMEPGCNKCHGHLGYELGSVRGATGVNLPLAPYIQTFETSAFDLIVTHLLIWAVVLAGIIWIGRKAALQREVLEATVKQRTAELEASRDAAQAGLNARETFIANMSHEIRTPMNAIMGYSEVVTHDPRLADDSRRRVSIIHSSAKGLLGILNDILDLTKIGNSNFTLENTAFHLKHAIEGLISTNRYRIQDKGLQFGVDYSDALPVVVEGDPTRLRQVIGNLLDNAIKFTDSGSIHLSVTTGETPDQIVFSIKDTGIGMNADQLNRIFQPFVQADQSTTRRFGGTGLGTGISKQIVEMMGGEMWVDSTEGEGSNFQFMVPLPVASSTENALFANVEDERFQSTRIFNVLIAEDVETNADLLEIWLKDQGHTVTWVQNGAEAVKRVKQEKFDVVLMDIQMPVMDGLQATQKIRENESETHSAEPMPIIALTASVMREDIDKCKAVGIDDVISKPVDRNELFRRLEELPAELGNPIESPQALPDLNPDVGVEAISRIADPEAAKDRWGGLGNYTEALKAFSITHETDPALLTAYLAETPQDVEKATTLLHGLKGTAGNLLLQQIYSLSEQLEHSLQNADTQGQPRLLLELRDAMEETACLIEAIPSGDGQEQQKETALNANGAAVKIRGLLETLLEAADQLSPDLATPVIEDLEKYLAPPILKSIKESVSAFDFERAKKVIAAEIEKLSFPHNSERLS